MCQVFKMVISFDKTRARRAAAMAAQRAEAMRLSQCYAGPAARAARMAEFRRRASRARVLAERPTEPASDEAAAVAAAISVLTRDIGLDRAAAAAASSAGPSTAAAAGPAAAGPGADSLPILGRRDSSSSLDEAWEGAFAMDG